MNPTQKFEEFIRKFSAGETEVENALRLALTKFESTTLSSVMEDPAPGYSMLFRTWRGAAALTSEGRLMSTELLHIADWQLFATSPEERLANLSEAKWTSTGTFLTPHLPEKMTRSQSTILDYAGDAVGKTVLDHIQRAEVFIVSALKNTEAETYLLEFPPSDPKVFFRGAGRLKPGPRRALEAIISSYLVPDYQNALGTFRSRLDEGILNIMENVRINTVNSYNWLGGWDYGLHNAQQGLHRRQAATTFPMFWSLVSMPIGPVREAVDEAHSLIPVLSRETSLPDNAVKALRNVTPTDFNLVAPPTKALLNEFVAPVATLPKGVPAPRGGEWTTFREAAILAGDVSRHARDGELRHALMRASGGKWSEMDPEKLRKANIHLRDMLIDIHSNAFVPAAKLSGLSNWRYHHTMQALTGNRTLQQIADAADAWEQNYATIHEHLSGAFPPDGARSDGEWMPMMKKNRFVASNGLIMHFLVTEDDLRDEGRAMHHCVGGYSNMCMYSGVHIASIRTPGGERVATVEFREDHFLETYHAQGMLPTVPLSSRPMGVVQIRGPHNDEPGYAARQALWDFTQGVAGGSVKIDRQELSDAALLRQSTRRGGNSQICYDFTMPDALDMAWRQYSDMMPKSVAKRGPFRVIGTILEEEEKAKASAPEPASEPAPEPENQPDHGNHPDQPEERPQP